METALGTIALQSDASQTLMWLLINWRSCESTDLESASLEEKTTVYEIMMIWSVFWSMFWQLHI